MAASSSTSSSKPSTAKIPSFDENNFALWKIKALYALESVDEDMLDCVNSGVFIPTYQPMKNNAPDGDRVMTPKKDWTTEDKRKIGLDVRARAAISYALPYSIFSLVQNCTTAKEMMDTLSTSFEGTEETKAAQVNDLNRRYEHFFAKKGETLTQTFNRFNTLVNDLRRLAVLKHRTVLVQKFLDSLGPHWDTHVDVLKNSEKIETMDLASLYGNLRYYEESKLQRKELMKDSQRDSAMALYSGKIHATASDTDVSSDSDSSDSDDCDKDLQKVVASAALIVKTFEKSGRNFSKFQKKFDGKKRDGAEKKEKLQCFNCGSTEHFAKDCKQKKNKSSDEYWKQKYNKLVDKLKSENLEHKVLIAEEEKWVTEDESSDEDVKCFMVQVDKVDDGTNVSTFSTDMASAEECSRKHNADSSTMYQVKNFVNYSSNEKIAMFEYMGVLNLKKNLTIQNMQTQIDYLQKENSLQNDSIKDLLEKLRVTCLSDRKSVV